MENYSIDFLHTLKKLIYDLRTKIDKIDSDILELVNSRLKLVKKIGQIKRKRDCNIIDDIRENELLARLDRINKGPLEPNELHVLFYNIIAISRAVQAKKHIAYVGTEATFAHMVALRHFGMEAVLYTGVSNEYDVFEEISSGFCDYGLISLDSTSGTYMSQLLGFFTSNSKIYAECCNKVSYELVAKKLNPKIVNTAYICKDMIEQCYSWLQLCLPHVRILECEHFDDAVAKTINNESYATVGFSGTARFFKLQILFSSKGIVEHPSARYLVISNDQPILSDKNKTSVLCALQNTPDTLMNFFKVLFDIEIISIEVEQCSIGTINGNGLFLIDFIGHTVSKKFTMALSDLARHVLWIKNLGTYPIRSGENFS